MQVSKDSNTMVSDMYPTDFLLKMDFVWNLVGEPFCNQKIRTDSNKTAIGNVSALEKKKKNHWKLFGTQDRTTMQN